MPKTVPWMRKSCLITSVLALPFTVSAQTPAAGPDKNPPAKETPAKDVPAGSALAREVASKQGAGKIDAVDPSTTYTQAAVRAMWIKTTPTVMGGSSPFTVMVAPNRTGDAAVGLIEQAFGSAGDMWKSSAWIAAIAASNASNYLLTDHEFLLRVHGYIDGPSAGMLMAATMIALMNQDTIRPNVTITGTVNPDGTVGPVSGIPQKLDGAKKSGIKELGYPMIDNGDDGQVFKDLEKLGKEKGVVMVPIDDINAAYKFLTGRTLGDPKALDDSELGISPALIEKYKTATDSLLKEVRTRVTTGEERYGTMMSKMSAADKKRYADDRDLTFQYIRESESFTKKEAWVMAHSKAVMAELSTRFSEKYLQWQQAYAKHDAKALSAIYKDSHDSAEQMLNAMQEMVRPTLKAPTLAGRIAGFNDRLNYWSVRAQWLAASAGRDEINRRQQAFDKKIAAAKGKQAALDALKGESEEIGLAMRDEALRLTILEGRIRAFTDFACQVFDGNKTPSPDHTELNKRLAEAYGPAARAGLAYFDSTVIGGLTHNSGGSASEKRGAILQNDIAFRACSEAAEFAVHADEKADDSLAEGAPEAVADRLACGVYAYLGLAGLMNKYYNLAVNDEEDEASREEHRASVTLRKGNTVTRMMERSRTRVLKEARMVKEQLGFIPEAIKMNFSLAETKRNDDNDTAKLDALTSYWRAQLFCKLSLLMARAK